jgi:hypothetical protein
MGDEFVFQLLFPNREETAAADTPTKKWRISSLLLQKELIEDEKVLRQKPKDFQDEVDRFDRQLRTVNEVIEMHKMDDYRESDPDGLDRLRSVVESLNAGMKQVTTVELKRLHDERTAIEKATATQLGVITERQAFANSVLDSTNVVLERK